MRITRCYRTVCPEATLFLAKIPPGDLLMRERELIRRRKRTDPDVVVSILMRETRAATIEEWES